MPGSGQEAGGRDRVSEEERRWRDRRPELSGTTIGALTSIPSQTGTSEGRQQSGECALQAPNSSDQHGPRSPASGFRDPA